jgi:hypothetical protein
VFSDEYILRALSTLDPDSATSTPHFARRLVYRLRLSNLTIDFKQTPVVNTSIDIYNYRCGDGEIRTREGLTPTRFPSERTRPLCDVSGTLRF